MKEKYILKCFITFLKRNNALNIYNEYLQKYRQEKNAISFLIQHCTDNPTDLIMNAFPWRSNKIVSWGKLHKEWHDICKENNFIKE